MKRYPNEGEDGLLVFKPKKIQRVPGGTVRANHTKLTGGKVSQRLFLKKCDEYRVKLIKDIQTHLIKMAPKALALKDAILSSEKQSVWLRNTVGTEVLDRLAPKPTQNISVKGAIVTAQYSDAELKKILMDRLLKAAEQPEGEEDGPVDQGQSQERQ